MPLARYLEAGLKVGLGSDVAGGPEASLFSVMRVGFYAQAALRTVGGEERTPLGPLDWLRLGTLDGARALGIEGRIGSIEAGKEADLIAVDPRLTSALPDLPYDAGARGPRGSDEPADLPTALGHGPRRLGPRPPPRGPCGRLSRERALSWRQRKEAGSKGESALKRA